MHIEIKGCEAIFTILKKDRKDMHNITGDFKKLKLERDDNCKYVRSFYETLESHFLSMNPDRIAIVKRNKRGMFSGGAVSFKIEGLIQLFESRNVSLVSPHTLRKFEKDNKIPLPNVNKYQKESCLLALYLLEK